MNKVICDVCGADYPDTAKKCPVCGCVQTGAAQTAAGNMAGSGERTPTKGGHFSKSNVKKRMKNGAAAQQAAQAPRAQRPRREERFEEEEMEAASNRGLIIIVIVLLLAIIAVSTYIAITFMDRGNGTPSESTQPSASSPITDPSVTDPSVTEPSASEPSVDPSQPSTEPSSTRIPCQGLTIQAEGGITVSEICFSAMNSYQRIFAVAEPADCTDAIMFESMNAAVVTVDAQGYITAVGNGNTFVQVRCGDEIVRILVKCNFTEPPVEPSQPTDPSNPSQPTDPSQPSEPSQPADKELKLNRKDFSLFSVGESWNVHRGCEIPAADITWSSSDENVATVTNGKVVAVGPGKATIRAEYNGQVATCIVYCQIKATEPTEPSESSEPSEPSDSSEPSEPTEPSEPAVEHKLLVNGNEPKYLFNGKDNTADVSLSLSGSKSCKISITNAENVAWSNNDEAVCSYADGVVTAIAKGRALLTVTIDGVEFTVCIRVGE